METPENTVSEMKSLYDVMELLPFYHPFLTKIPQEFVFENNLLVAEDLAESLVKKMVELGGAGLSANQVGLNLRVFAVGNAEANVVMFNPNIVGRSPESCVMTETCLSLPNFSLNLRRPESVVVSYQNVSGDLLVAKYDGIASRIIQHEYDKMQGLAFTHLASKMKLKHELKKWKNHQKKFLRKVNSV